MYLLTFSIFHPAKSEASFDSSDDEATGILSLEVNAVQQHSANDNNTDDASVNEILPVDVNETAFSGMRYHVEELAYTRGEEEARLSCPPFPGNLHEAIPGNDVEFKDRYTFGVDGERIVTFNCHELNGHNIPKEHQEFILRLADRTDIMLIFTNVLPDAVLNLFKNEKLLAESFGDAYHYRAKVLENITGAKADGVDIGGVKFTDLLSFNNEKAKYRDGKGESKFFVLTDSNKTQHKIDMSSHSLYFVDIHMKTMMKEQHDQMVKHFPMKGLFPSDSYCMTKDLDPQSRADQGPNGYLGQIYSRTGLHADGHRTVSAIHLNATGKAKVKMLDRLSEKEYIQAVCIIKNVDPEQWKEMTAVHSLGEEPHSPNATPLFWNEESKSLLESHQ